MSRIIVKNLPPKISEQSLREHFASHGASVITDCQLKYSPNGNFRNFAFIGFKEDEHAQQAAQYFNNTFIDTKRIVVELCSDLTSKPQPAREKFGNKRKGNHDDAFSKKRNNSIDYEKEGQDPKNSSSPKIPSLPEKSFEFTVKVKGLSKKVKKKQIKDWIRPVKYISLRIPRNAHGFAYLSFATRQDMNLALMKHRGFLEGRRIDVIEYDVKSYRSKIDKMTEMAQKQEKWKHQNVPPLESSQDTDTRDESLAETGRLFLRNLSYECTQEDLEKLFSTYGKLSEVHLSIDTFSGKPKGFAFVEFMFPEHALIAFNELDGKPFQGRLLHILPARAKPDVQMDDKSAISSEKSSYKKEKKTNEHQGASLPHNWNSLFISSNAIANVIAEKAGVTKAQLLADKDAQDSLAVRLALAETQIVNETRQFLVDHGINLDAFNVENLSKDSTVIPLRSKTVLLAKNLPDKTTDKELHDLFSKYGTICRLILPPHGMTAIIEMGHPNEAKSAFKNLAYSNFKHVPLYLEWAPTDVLKFKTDTSKQEPTKSTETTDETPSTPVKKETPMSTDSSDVTTLFVKNLNFSTQESALREHFSRYGHIVSATVAKKKVKGKELSMGFGFIQFANKESTNESLKNAQGSMLDGHTLQLSRSTRHANTPVQHNIESFKSVGVNETEQDSNEEKEKWTKTKLVVRNIPFEASENEVRQLFVNFGELKACRLPKKFAASAQHRGFAFVDFVTASNARQAFKSLSASTHLYGRRLILEWASDQTSTA